MGCAGVAAPILHRLGGKLEEVVSGEDVYP